MSHQLLIFLSEYPVYVAVFSGVLFFLIGLLFWKYLAKFKRRSKLLSHVHEGIKGEMHARDYLKRHGFRIIKEQAHSEQVMIIDGERTTFTLRADFIVSKNGKRYIVDAKSGIEGSQPASMPTRRQLLEYYLYYNVNGVYLYNSRENKLHLIHFILNRFKMNKPFFLWVSVILFLSACALLLYTQLK